MALFYGYLFPTIFLLAFWTLYRYEPVPLVRHIGELLTVTALGGACFGLPTTMVSERERGVWRRYRLTPIHPGTIIATTVVARYLLLIIAALLQLGLAMAVGMPLPRHPWELWLAFTFVAFAFLGLGLVIAMLADNVPSVQALGQTIFLPMLIIGGVAVRLESLPDWALHVSAFFPGRYAVEALQACASGGGLETTRFALFALFLIGGAGCLAGAGMFRWDAQERFAARENKAWVLVALAGWVAVGLSAESLGYVAPDRSTRAPGRAIPAAIGLPSARPDLPAPPPVAAAPDAPASPDAAETDLRVPAPEKPAAVEPSSGPRAAEPLEGVTAPDTAFAAAPWYAVTMEDIDRDLDIGSLPPDQGVVTPIAPVDEEPFPHVADQLACMRRSLRDWGPGRVADPVQRVRNVLFVAAVPDVQQMEEIESVVPQVVFERLRQDVPRDRLIKILYWIALHPYEGDASAIQRVGEVCVEPRGPDDVEQIRERAAIYAAKLLGRLTGRIALR